MTLNKRGTPSLNLKKKKYWRLSNQGLQKERRLKENNETTMLHGVGMIKTRPQREDPNIPGLQRGSCLTSDTQKENLASTNLQ